MWTWGIDMWCILSSTLCMWVCSCNCYLQRLALFMPLPRVLFRALVLSHPSLIAKCQGELSAAAVFPGHSHPCSVFEVVLQYVFEQILSLTSFLSWHFNSSCSSYQLILLSSASYTYPAHTPGLTAYYLILKME